MTRYRQPEMMEAARAMSTLNADPAGAHGEVFTRRWVVDLILDLAGYQASADLGASAIVEPACGTGAFLVPIIERLAESCATHGRSIVDMGAAIRAFDLLARNVDAARASAAARLVELDQPAEVAERLSREWVTQGDFLLDAGLDDSRQAGFVVGNPPYVRLEDVPAEVSAAYRSECGTMRGRADLYVGFFEKGLSLLGPEGRLAFICADRWMHNHYGERLRALVAADYAVDTVMAMHAVDAFEDAVSAYPAITVIRKGFQGPARVVETADGFDETDAGIVARWHADSHEHAPSAGRFQAGTLQGWFPGSGHWPTGSPGALELIADLEERFAPLEDWLTGTRVGIGVATGCDDVFIVEDAPGVEPCRLLPMLTAHDISHGTPDWSGRFLVNPWEDGRLVDLDDYPGLAAYIRGHAARIKQRHVARCRPASWYRTIDRVAPELQARPKLLLPDLKPAAHPVLDTGDFYPHHNLYYVVSDKWDLEVLGGLLLSDIANLFVGAYCVKMRGGTYRFQAQYLRKIRVPDYDDISAASAAALTEAFRRRDRPAATAAAAELYGISRANLLAAVA
ncbi:MAG: N-6 DNA methylase [Acidimicrobiaceae bacterium]|nr:N-6 DNA methylase [Acidimicrobiaceae bacterium]MCY4279912.1 N-6 DNA methylase [Acidimicrobiaceae bacterium]MCY4294712.1 N-6 DNA methylase [Acidimicrobiaceae bacterium]